ncbi:hypothetical protein GFS31_12870 [Leptolyngbya sp. BL0902]|uniref:hypothetical protein n=1 Tax=Leptolyngbya sp. BL0902 TaxID=1115757 RepID=UPI0018E81EF9|nr:hypothetical protein [Leptolyngbya sp. BL0902]QQE64606.1 hypothetical protein GFS31_12870 [Leptolyngbya sp. BL0902]
MGAAVFFILFGLGVLLATVGGLVGLVDAFRVSPTWGLLSLFVPFALLVFCIKFWGSRKLAKVSLLTSLAGMLSMLAGVPFMANFVQQQMARENGQPGDVAIEPLPNDQPPLDQVPIDQVPIDQQPIDQVPIDQVPIDQAPVEGDPNFATPMVPAAPQLANIARAELIQSTDPEERVRQINNRRPDPFATVPIPPPPVVTPPPPAPVIPAAGPVPGGIPAAPTATAPTATAPGATAPGAGSPGAGSPTGAAPGGSPTTPGGTAGSGQPGQPPVALAPLPPLPEPTQAREVVVTGVVTIGDRTYAIVQSPSEPTGRYVMAGQRVAGGSVLVKRIDMRGNEPIVVLEQNGVELSRSIGVPEEEEGTAAT